MRRCTSLTADQTRRQLLEKFQNVATLQLTVDHHLAELRPKITWSGNRRPSAEELDKMHHAAHENCFHCKLGQNERDGGRTVAAVPAAPVRQQPLRRSLGKRRRNQSQSSDDLRRYDRAARCAARSPFPRRAHESTLDAELNDFGAQLAT